MLHLAPFQTPIVMLDLNVSAKPISYPCCHYYNPTLYRSGLRRTHGHGGGLGAHIGGREPGARGAAGQRAYPQPVRVPKAQIPTFQNYQQHGVCGQGHTRLLSGTTLLMTQHI